MKLQVTGSISELLTGISHLSEELNFTIGSDGYPISVVKRPGPIEVKNANGQGEICFEKKIHFYRALGLWLQNFEKSKEFHIVEHPQFETSGVMIDASRNAVLTTDGIQMLLRKMAVMGLNLAMLYTEDTYEVPEYPYFGYMRGRYSEIEIKICDDYAEELGIEMIPCIQTLAHLKEALKWNYSNEFRDTESILLAGEPKTYEFLRTIIKSATKPYRSNRIHIGMDEAHELGLGKYLELNGYHNRFEIMNQHLKQVIHITEDLDLKPMIWSDMYFRLASKVGNYYDKDATIPEEIIKMIPNVQMVYWDYYHTEESHYEKMLTMHKLLVDEPIFAGGLWTWNGIAPNYGKAFRTTEAALKANKKFGIKEVFATMWGDNGAETPIQTVLPGMQLYAEYTYHQEVGPEHLAERFEFCTGYHLEDFLLLNHFDETPGVMKDNLYESNPSKFLLWQDILIGLYDKNIEGFPIAQHYEKLIQPLHDAKGKNHDMNLLFHFYEELARVLSVKAELGINLKNAYDQADKDAVHACSEKLSSLRKDVEKLRLAHKKLWFSTNKPFGWEVLDIRYGGLLTRIHSAEERVQEWLDDPTVRIEELEAERLFYNGIYTFGEEGTLGRNLYHRIVSNSVFSD
ncbi:beta-N-acetylhexosaminidase [Bacillus sp. OK048]|uniref:beta-N-acetylhexosaminidase n=1 Tax=Bacillus sp. OK048 TaxID=1882761 RepID=UPI000886DE47|nr:beta-N-acetylhexosaminidase [Bacillus sp. OK048]SDM89925.1 Glycosyl hydrolase family 20, catalytic domain [Bacillus sp. OK048]